jgi:hypothetical protein
VIVRRCLGVGRVPCARLIPHNQRRCPEHKLAQGRAQTAARPPVLAALYNSAAWQRLRKQAIAGGACHWCGASGVRLVGDHLQRPEDRPDLALDPSNIVAACYSCNNQRRRPRGVVRRAP